MNRFKVMYARATSNGSVELAIVGDSKADAKVLKALTGGVEGEIYISGGLAAKFLNQDVIYNDDCDMFDNATVKGVLHMETEFVNADGKTETLDTPQLRFEEKTWRLRLDKATKRAVRNDSSKKSRKASGLLWSDENGDEGITKVSTKDTKKANAKSKITDKEVVDMP